MKEIAMPSEQVQRELGKSQLLEQALVFNWLNSFFVRILTYRVHYARSGRIYQQRSLKLN
ncbi:hypothetical protein PR048_019687 [Dryococelus australis]|uniref:Uncharacterized protein n=1 Tax=Dryococelus australis TaxID=614101 RepID=A0ABQ9H4F8_9NEOP|nr:hypothetical protein PR048_019687 [Dryococelus australis]